MRSCGPFGGGLALLAALGCSRTLPPTEGAPKAPAPVVAWPAQGPARSTAAGPTIVGAGSDDLVPPWTPRSGMAAPLAAASSAPAPATSAPALLGGPPPSVPGFLTLPGTLGAWRGGTVIASDAEGAAQCTLSSYAAPGKTVGYCAKVARGPLLVTDLSSTGTCKADLYALGGTLAKPVWVALMPRGAATHVTGASLAVPAGGDLIVGVIAASEAAIGHDLSCSITWSGWALEARRIVDQPGF